MEAADWGTGKDLVDCRLHSVEDLVVGPPIPRNVWAVIPLALDRSGQDAVSGEENQLISFHYKTYHTVQFISTTVGIKI